MYKNGLEHTWPLYLWYHFSLTIINKETAGFAKILHIFVVWMFQVFPLILENLPFQWIIPDCLNISLKWGLFLSFETF